VWWGGSRYLGGGSLGYGFSFFSFSVGRCEVGGGGGQGGWRSVGGLSFVGRGGMLWFFFFWVFFFIFFFVVVASFLGGGLGGLR